jgi:ferredoxin-NAD(P)+ reductase (naphthalene dioxygenase ferredoxin-specific)
MSKRAQVTSIRRLADSVFEWRLRMLEPPAITSCPWQYVSLDGGLVLCAKLISDGVGTRYLAQLAEGDEARFTGPMGMFVLDLQPPGDVGFAATGTGIAPFLPLAHEALAREERGDVLLYWGLRSQTDLFYLDELQQLAAANPRLTVQVTLSRPRATGPARAAASRRASTRRCPRCATPSSTSPATAR